MGTSNFPEKMALFSGRSVQGWMNNNCYGVVTRRATIYDWYDMKISVTACTAHFAQLIERTACQLVNGQVCGDVTQLSAD